MHAVSVPAKRSPLLVGSILIIAALSFDGTANGTEKRFSLAEDDVVVFLGGTNMVRLQRSGSLEVMLTRAFASQRPRFRDFSWEADTVFRLGTVIERWRTDGFGSLDDQLRRFGTTVVIAQFGQLESMAGPSGVGGFTSALERLVDTFQRHARLVVLISPTPFEKPPSPLIPDVTQHNASLALYTKAMETVAAKRGARFVDLSTLATHRLTDNGMHVGDDAQSHVAEAILRQLGIPAVACTPGDPLRAAVLEKHRLWYDYWRPANWKLLYGDDAERQFTRGGANYIPFKQEWKKLVPLIDQAERRVGRIARGGTDPGPSRPATETLHGDPGADIEQELAAFTAPEGLRVNLFASEREGLTSPLAIRWDPAGRMYVTVTTTYPHVFPGDVPNDKVIALDDTDGDGAADVSTDFADGLNIPTGVEWGDGGLYVGQNTELLFLADTDGDGQADRRRVVLGGFGNGDSHQTINSFVWSPGGELFLGQGDGIESRVETPWGSSDLYQAGFYRFRPQRLQLHPLLDDFMGPGNPWGVAFDRWGQILSIDGAGGVTFLSPGQIPTTHRLPLPTVGKPGGYCGIAHLDGPHLPESMRGDFAVGDFRVNRVSRFSVEAAGSGFSLQWEEPILRSSHRNFRPVDVKVGPDGAIYVVDWYNPIICHQDDAYRDPTRDKAHGRIWRLSADSPAARPPNLLQVPIRDVVANLASPSQWARYQAKRALTVRNADAAAQALRTWVRSLDPHLPEYEHHLYEALGAYATIEVVEPVLLKRLLGARDPRGRAYAARMVGRWHDRLDDPLELLARSVADTHPQVRMEAVIACAAIPSARSIEVAARVIDFPVDAWLDYAFKQAVHHLQPLWKPAFQRGEISFGHPSHLAAVLNEAGGTDALESLKSLIESGELPPPARSGVVAAMLTFGGAAELRDYGLSPKPFTRSGRYDAAAHADALARLIETARLRDVRPAGELAPALRRLMDSAHPRLYAHALTLAGIWQLHEIQPRVAAVAQDESLDVMVRAAAFGALVALNEPASRDILTAHAVDPNPTALRCAAIQSLAKTDMHAAARHAAALFESSEPSTPDAAATLGAFLNRTGGAEALAAALESTNLKPAMARRLVQAVFAMGRSDPALLASLHQASGPSSQTPAFSATFVKQLATDANANGDVKRGAVLYEAIGCAACHQIAGQGGTVGPDLTAVGTTLSAERIVEELLWPNRQVKEGYSVVQVITDEGRIHHGYERKTKDSHQAGDLTIEELATGERITIAASQIEQMRVAGSSMPDGLTAALTRPELLDLVRYLSELGRLE